MSSPEPHRKQVKHYEDILCLHELTFSCYDRLPLLREHSHCELLAESLDRAMDTQGWLLHAFVFMPEHVHLLVGPVDEGASVSRLLQAIKRPMSYRVKRALQASENPLLGQLMIQERPGRRVFRFWQAGGGFDRNLWERRAVESSLDYLHANPVRRGLCRSPEEWLWSSWHAYHGVDRLGLPRVEICVG